MKICSVAWTNLSFGALAKLLQNADINISAVGAKDEQEMLGLRTSATNRSTRSRKFSRKQWGLELGMKIEHFPPAKR